MKFLTWNILAPECSNYSMKKMYGLKKLDQENRLHNIKDTIDKINPDVLCLQEVTKKWIPELENIGNYKYVTVAKCFVEKRKIKVGNVILVKEGSGVKYKKQRKKEKKYAYNYIVLYYNNNKIYVTNGHYRWGNTTFDSFMWVMDNIKKSSPHFYKNLINPDISSVICGDFNCSDINKELYFSCKDVIKEDYKWCNVEFENALIPRYEYQLCNNYLENFGFKNSKYMLNNWKKLYTTVKSSEQNIDHDDKIYSRNLKINKIYYGDYINKLNSSSIQPETGLLYIKCDNSKRTNWKNVKEKLTSDHRWILINFL